MQDDSKRGQDLVEEAAAESFPASDPPAWTTTRAGKPERASDKEARCAGGDLVPRNCEVIGLFRNQSEAKVAADALLKAGFNVVDLGPPRSHGNLGAGIGNAGSARSSSLGLCAALGALAAGLAAALFMPRGARHVAAAAAGGAIGAASAHAAAGMMQKRSAGWPPNGVLVRAGFTTADEQKRALGILEAEGACKLHVSWPQPF